MTLSVAMNLPLWRTVCALLLALGLATPALAQSELRPVDEAASQPDFFSFRAQLFAAIASRDVQAVISMLDKDIKCSFGGDHGIDDFKRMWDIDSAGSKFWETMATVLALGGTFDAQGAFVAPYIFSRWPDDVDPIFHVAVIGSQVRVRSAARADAPAIAALSFAIVELASGNQPDPEWTPVKLPGDRTGYLATRFVRNALDYRAIFEKKDGRWLLTTFVAGD